MLFIQAIFIVLLILGRVEVAQEKTTYTTRADCTHAMELHAAEINRLHDRNERTLTELIVAQKQLELWGLVTLDDFVESPDAPTKYPEFSPK